MYYLHLVKFRMKAHLSHTTQVIALQISAVFSGHVIGGPGCVTVALMVLYNVLSRHGNRWQGKTGCWRHGRHIHWGQFGLEAQLRVGKLKCEPCLGTCRILLH